MSIKGKMQILDHYSDRQEQELIKGLKKTYKRALDETTTKMSKIYQKYANSEGNLTFTEMQKYGRLENLMQDIRKNWIRLYKGNESEMMNNLSRLYERNYYFTGFTLEAEAQVRLAYASLNNEVIKRAILNPISGLTLPDRLEKNRNEIIIKTREELTQGLVQGESYPKQVKRIEDVYEGDINKAARIVQTENNRVRNEAKNASYEHAADHGVEVDKVWVATLDSETRDAHAELDGQKADADGYFHVDGYSALYPGGFGVARLDINCRCTTRPEIDNIAPEKRRARDKMGQSRVIPYTTYDNWKRNRVA